MNIPIIKTEMQKSFLDKLRSRSANVQKDVTAAVSKIIENVRENGDKALLEYTEKFDNIKLDCLEVKKDEILSAYKRSSITSQLERAAENIKAYHKNQLRKGFEIKKENGTVIGQKIRPLSRVGIYVPGGTAAYPSSVLMNALPAKVAGVDEIIMVTPPQKNDDILAAAYIAGVNRIFRIGGAQAVAALAYGTETVPKVDKTVGPGNIYVATAKRLLYGVMDIDMIAGPSEILIIADEYAPDDYIAADMMSQAEHDILASATVLCFSEDKAKRVTECINRQIKSLSRKEIIEKSIEDYGGIIICENTENAIDLANEIAPEHLELMVQDPFELLDKIKNAGSVFLGYNTPEPLGDYYAGPNHVLPTSGTARFFSPLSVDDFIKKYSYIYYTEQALAQSAHDVTTLAKAEGLTAHAGSIEERIK